MALIIEDGSNVAGANSLATAAELVAYASLRGLSYPDLEADQEAALVLAMDYLFNFELKLKGSRTYDDQALPFPRQNVFAFGVRVGAESIPLGVKDAQIEAALTAADTSILITSSGQNIASEEIGPLKTSYFSGGSRENVRLDRVDAKLKPYANNYNNTLVRI